LSDCLKVKLLNSIGDNFDEAMKSSQSTQEYLEQFRNIVKGVEVRRAFSLVPISLCSSPMYLS
jgi:hypothetical protein